MELKKNRKLSSIEETGEKLAKEILRVELEKKEVENRIKELQEKNVEIASGGTAVVVKTGFALDELESAAVDSNYDLNTQKIHFLRKVLKQHDVYSDPGYRKAAREYANSITDEVEKRDAEILKNIEAVEKAKVDLDELIEATDSANYALRNQIDELIDPLKVSVYRSYAGNMGSGKGALYMVQTKLRENEQNK
jgi:hypothetical protein